MVVCLFLFVFSSLLLRFICLIISSFFLSVFRVVLVVPHARDPHPSRFMACPSIPVARPLSYAWDRHQVPARQPQRAAQQSGHIRESSLDTGNRKTKYPRDQPKLFPRKEKKKKKTWKTQIKDDRKKRNLLA